MASKIIGKKSVKRVSKPKAKRVRRRNPDLSPAGVSLEEFKTQHEEIGPIQDFLLHHVAPTVAGYGVNRLITTLASHQLKARAASLGGWVNYSPPLVSALAGTGMYFLTKYVKALQHYHEAVMVGNVVAFIHTTALTFAPKFAWLLGDVDPALSSKPYMALPAQPAAQEEPAADEVMETEVPADVVAGSSMDGASIPEPDGYGEEYGSLGDEAN